MHAWSVAKAKDGLTKLLREVEGGEPVEITRRGEPVAVVLSVEAYRAMQQARPSFYDAMVAWRAECKPEDFAEDGWLEGVRSKEPGRDFEW